jgi:Ankyrin repeats (3 copies)
MTIADDIISGRMPDFDYYIRHGETLDDIDEYGFTPLIETSIANQFEIAQALITKGVQINKHDVTGRSALHWAIDNNNVELSKLLLKSGANPNSYNRGGQSLLVYPLLREQWVLKQLLYNYGADLNFAYDFINAKLLGHRFELRGDVDILTTQGEYIELDFEGFILEFSLDVLRDSLQRFIGNFLARKLRPYFESIYEIIDGYESAAQLLKFQHIQKELFKHESTVSSLLATKLLVLPIAYRGHAICFVRCGEFWAKIDRGENSLREGCINVYHIGNLNALTDSFLMNLLYKKQTERFVHHLINKQLSLTPIAQIPVTAQISGNCSWANIEAVVPTAYVLYQLATKENADIQKVMEDSLYIYKQWYSWDQDRALDECIQSFYLANAQRKASKAAILGAILFQSCVYGEPASTMRAEKILAVLMLPEYNYIIESYFEIYCIRRLTPKGNNLLKILEDNGYNPNIGVNPIATRLKKKKNR